jgi:hypothetical protein
LLLHSSNKYVLKNDSLEIRRGIVSFTRFIVTSSGFSDLIVNPITFRKGVRCGGDNDFSESEQNFNQKIAKVRHPMKVAEKIRFVMGRPMVRLGETEEGNVPTGRPQQYHRILPKERSACYPTSPPDFSP